MGRPSLRLTLRTRTTAAVLVVVTAVLLGCHFVLHRWTQAAYLAESRGRVEALARGLAGVSELAVVASDTAELHRLASLMLANPRVDYVLVRDARGTPLACVSKPGRDAPFEDADDDFIVGRAAVRRSASGVLDVFGGLDTPAAAAEEGEPIATVEVGYCKNSLRAEIRDAFFAPKLVIVSGCVIIGVMIWFIAGAWTRRLDRLLAAANRLARGEVNEPLAADRDDEIGTLLRAFERMRQAVHARDAELRRFNATLQEQVHQRTRELEAALARAEEASRAKSDFLANMSHEIRTPMTAMLGFAEVLADSSTPEHARAEAAQTILRSGKHLLQIINDILDLSKIESGRMTIETVPTAVTQVVEEIASTLRPAALAKKLTLEVRFDSPVPRTIRSDPTRLRQILFNLVGNAVKFTSTGGVSIHLRAEPERQTIEFRVRDTGIGIPPEQVARLFQPFAQGDSSMSRRFGGTGLGLAIARRLCELLGGSLSVESQPGQGSTFIARLATGPVDGVPKVESIVAEPRKRENLPLHNSLAGVRILLCEDGVENQRLLLHILGRAGAETHLAENGRIALEALERARRDNRPFDLVLLDMQMPEMDGYTAARLARQANDPTPIVALTAHALSGDREKCLEAGCDDYLTKPVDRARLLETCRRWASARRRAA